MRELDLLLGRFLAAGLGALGREDLDRFERLLEHPDQDILAWLTGVARPEDADTREIVGILRRSMEQSNGDIGR